jgi:TonB family protein
MAVIGHRALFLTILGVVLFAAPNDISAQAGKVHEIVIAPTPAPDRSEDLPTYYLQMIRAKIEAAWHRPPLSRPVVALFTIERDGRLTDLRIETSSGDSRHDDEALRAIRWAQPFSPLPDSYPNTALIRLELK